VTIRPQIFYRDVPASSVLDDLIRAETAKLEHFFTHIVNCRVHIERTHQGRNPHAAALHVRIELSVPGEHLVVNHADDVRPLSSSEEDDSEKIGKASERQGEHRDPQVAVRDAFRAATRRLQDYVERRRGRL
jgi:hypothetical protein